MQINRIAQQVTNIFLTDVIHREEWLKGGSSFLEIYKAKNKVTILHASNLVILYISS